MASNSFQFKHHAQKNSPILERQLMFANQLFGLIRHSIMKNGFDFINLYGGIVYERQRIGNLLCAEHPST
jgi:hypothetical protein